MNGYFLTGVDGEQILVFRSTEHEEIYRVIARLAASRDKEIRALATKLEMEWIASEYATEKENKKNESTRLSSNTRPKDSKENQDRTRNRTNQVPSSQRRGDPRP
jgi:hypothetical protein